VTERSVFRVIDTGLRGARANIAFDQALIEAHKEQLIPDTIRFLRFTPSALIGRHQNLAAELRLDWCRAHGIELARRVTGGGAIVMEPGILGWELVFPRTLFGSVSLAELAAKICAAAATGLRRLGVEASFRPRNDIEVAGRKIGGTGGFFDGDTLFYQGTVLIDCDLAAAMQPLALADAKRAKHGISEAAERLTTVATLLGGRAPEAKAVMDALLHGFAEGLGIEPAPRAITSREEALARRLHREEIGTDAFVDGVAPFRGPDIVTAEQTLPGGTVRVYLKLEGPGRASVGRALFAGDFFVTPPRVIYDLEAALKGVARADAAAAAARFLAQASVEILSITPDAFARIVAEAAGTPRSSQSRQVRHGQEIDHRSGQYRST